MQRLIITRSISTVETHAFALGFYETYVIRGTLIGILGRLVKSEAYLDSRSIFGVLEKYWNTAEERFHFDKFGLRHSYANIQ